MRSTDIQSTGARAPMMPGRPVLGVAAGLVAGAAFISLNCWFAADGKPWYAPFRTIATVVQGTPPDEANPWIGVAIHIVLSIFFGMLFMVSTHPWLAGKAMAGLAGLAYGGVLYVINFQVLSRFVDYWSAFLNSTNQPFELATHLVFGAVLAVFLLPAPRRATPAVGGPAIAN